MHGPRAQVVRWGRSRGPALGAAILSAVLGLAASASDGVRRQDVATALRSYLKRQLGLSVQPDDLAWERAPAGRIGDAIAGASALVLAAPTEGAPRDLYRVRVRLTPSGRILAVDGATNLTRTAVGDDGSLVVAPPLAAVATRAFGRVQAVTVLELGGEPETAVADLGLRDRGQRAVTDLLATGSIAGVGRTIVRLEPAPESVQLAWRRGRTLEIRRAAGPIALVDAARARLIQGRGATVERVVHDPEAPILWAVETVRSVVGPAPIAWLEARTFAALDLGRRIQHGALVPPTAEAAPPPPPPPVTQGAIGWPPPAPPLRLEPGEPGEGVWHDSAPAFVKRLPGAPPAFLETFLRPDPARPYVRVKIVAMDLRQLSLGVVAGTMDPEPTVGPPGTGRLPQDRAVVDNLVAAFNGGFKTKHGEYGMVAERRILLPPIHDAATILVRQDGRIGIGSWPGRWRRVPDDVVSLRQNLDPLVDRGVLNPRRRRLWGFPLPGMDAMQTERSAICIDRGGNLLYFHGTDLSGPLLGDAMRLTSCSYGIHLDMNQYHCAFLYARIRDAEAWHQANLNPARARHDGHSGLSSLFEAQTIARGMMDPKRYLVHSPKDFFYVTLRPTMIDRPAYRIDGGEL